MTYKEIRKPWFYSVTILIALNSQIVGTAAGSHSPITLMLFFNIFAIAYMIINMFSDMKFEAKTEEVELTQTTKNRVHHLLQFLVVTCFAAGFIFCEDIYFLVITLCSMIVGMFIGGILNYAVDYGFYIKPSIKE